MAIFVWMHVIACQFDIAWEDKPTNFAKVESLLAQSGVPAESLIVLPELFATGFSMKVDRIAEGPRGETCRFLSDLARRYQSYIIGGVATHYDSQSCYNEAIIVDPSGNERGRYRKQKPFTLGGEGQHYSSGDRHLVATCGDVSISPFICYDLRFPELFRPSVRDGAQLISVIANWPEARSAHWTALLRARAIENQAYVVGVNRTGSDPGNTYVGQSCVIHPSGSMLAEADGTELRLDCDLDIASLLQFRRDLPFLADMRL